MIACSVELNLISGLNRLNWDRIDFQVAVLDNIQEFWVYRDLTPCSYKILNPACKFTFRRTDLPQPAMYQSAFVFLPSHFLGGRGRG